MMITLLFLLWQGPPQDEPFLDVHNAERAPAAFASLDYGSYKASVEKIFQFYRPSPWGKMEPQIIDSYGKHRVKSDGSKRLHKGWDMKAPVGTVISWVYPADFKVIEVRNSKHNGKLNYANYGKQMFIQTTINGKLVFLRFCHLDETSIKQSKTITKTQIQKQKYGIKIGTVGISGRPANAKRPHLHLEIWDKNWKLINTQTFFTGN